MTTLQQALHIFRKDAREFRWEIGAVLLLSLLMVVTGVNTWEAVQERGGFDEESPVSIMLVISWVLLIARAIHAEALPGDRHFWLTRPYSRNGLLLAKGLFIGAFILVPFSVAQAVVVAADGLPLVSYLGNILWNQMLVTAVILAPAAAIAALTRNLAQFLPATVLLVPIVIGIIDGGRFDERAMAWVAITVGIVLIASVAAAALVLQYNRRRTLRHALQTLGAVVASLIVFLAFPRSAAFAIQSAVTGKPAQAVTVRLGTPPKPIASNVTPNRFRQLVEFPLIIEGAQPLDVQLDAPRLTIRTLAGITMDYRGELRRRPNEEFAHGVFVDREFFEAAKNSPVTLRAEYRLTQLGNENSVTVPMDGTPVDVPNLGQCGTVAGYQGRTFLCRAAYRRPGRFFSDRIVLRPDEYYSWGFHFAPYPVRISIHPVKATHYELISAAAKEIAPLAPETPMQVSVREPVAYVQYTMEAPNVKLADFAIPEPVEDRE